MVTAVTRRIFPAVVRIDVAQEAYSEGKRTLRRGIGSGVIIDQQGRILTNYHVAGRAAEIFVTLANKERVPAKLIGDDHWTDLAIVQMDMDDNQQAEHHLQLRRAGRERQLVSRRERDGDRHAVRLCANDHAGRGFQHRTHVLSRSA